MKAKHLFLFMSLFSIFLCSKTRNLLFTWKHDTISTTDHPTSFYQGVYIQSLYVYFLQEPSLATNARPDINAVPGAINPSNTVKLSQTVIPEKRCTLVSTAVRGNPTPSGANIFFFRFSPTPSYCDLPTETQSYSGSLVLYWYNAKDLQLIENILGQAILQDTTRTNLSLIDFVINDSSSDIGAMITYTDPTFTVKYFAVALISFMYNSLSLSKLFYIQEDSSNVYAPSLDPFIYPSTLTGFFANGARKFGFLFKSILANSNEVLMLGTIDFTQTTPQFSKYTVTTAAIKLYRYTVGYDTSVKRIYVVYTVNSCEATYIRMYEYSPNLGYIQFGSEKDITADIQCIYSIKVINGFNYIIALGTRSLANSVPDILVVYRYNIYTGVIDKFSEIAPVIPQLARIYDINYAINTEIMNPTVDFYLTYRDTASNEYVIKLTTCLFFVNEARFCQLTCNDNEGENFSTYMCVVCSEVTPTKLFAYQRKCVSQCPYGTYYNEYSICLYCEDATAPYMDVYTNKCVPVCGKSASMYIDEDKKVCSECKKLGKFLRELKTSKSCVDQCSSTDFVNNTDNICYACATMNMFFEETKCVDVCRSLSIIEDPNKKICKRCQDYDPPQLYCRPDATCVTTCPKGTIKNIDQPECVSCKDLGYVNNFGTCSLECSVGTAPDSYGVCKPCNEINNKRYQEICVDTCPTYYVPNNNSTCILCKDNGLYYYNSTCIPGSCPEHYVADQLNICYECYTRGLYYYNHQCLVQCPVGTLVNSKNECISCGSGFYLDRKTCVKKCSSMTFTNSTNVCYHCSDYGKFMLENQCVDECPDNAAKILFYNFCDLCISNGHFYSNNECVDNCPTFSYISERGICVQCKLYYKLLYNSTCVDACPSGTNPDFNTYNCISSDDLDPCQNHGDYNELNNTCACYPGYFGNFCQYDQLTLEDIVQDFETRLIAPIQINQTGKIELYINQSYINNISNYLHLIDEIEDAFSEKLFNDVYKKLNYFIRYGLSSVWLINHNEFLIFDEYLIFLQIKYRRILSRFIITQENTNNTQNTTVVTSKLRNLADIVKYINNTNFSRFTESFFASIVSTFSEVKSMIDTLVKNLLYNQRINYLYVDQSSMFKINVGMFRNYLENPTQITNETLNETDSNSTSTNQTADNSTNGGNLTLDTINLKFLQSQSSSNSTSNTTGNANTNTTSNTTTSNTTSNSSRSSNTSANNDSDTYSPFPEEVAVDLEEFFPGIKLYLQKPIAFEPVSNLTNLITYSRAKGYQNSYFNISNCEEYLRLKFNLSSEDYIVSYSSEFHPDVNFNLFKFNKISNSLKVALIHLNFANVTFPQNLCGTNEIFYHLKINQNSKFDSLIQRYQYFYQNFHINLLNKDEPFFHERCYRFSANNSYSKLTLHQRRKFFFLNYTLGCATYENHSIFNSRCEISHITEDYYAICKCKYLGEVEAVLVNEFLPDLMKYNFDLITCMAQAFGYWSDFINIGCYVIIGNFFVCIFFQLFFYLWNRKLVEKEIEQIIYNDCLTLEFNEKEFPHFGEKLKENNNVEHYQKIYENMILERVFQGKSGEYAISKDVKNIDTHTPSKLGLADSSNNKDNSADQKDEKSFLTNDQIQGFQTKKNEFVCSNLKCEKIRKIRMKYFTKENEKKKYTLPDIDAMEIKVRREHDTRTRLQYYYHYLLNYHKLFYAFFKKSVLLPQSLRIIVLFMYTLLFAFFNATFYFEPLVEARQVGKKKDDFLFTFTNEYSRNGMIISYLITIFTMMMFKQLMKIPQKRIDEFNTLLWTIDHHLVKRGRRLLGKVMASRYLAIVLIYIIMSIIALFYCAIFCGIYPHCVNGWLYSTGICIAFDFVFVDVILIPGLAVIARDLGEKSKFNKWVYFLFEGLPFPNKF